MDDSDRERIDELEQQVNRLTARVAELESATETDSGTVRQDNGTDDGPFDRYDGPVLEYLDGKIGQTFSPRQVVRLYGRLSTIQSKDKRKQRAKKLVQSDYFERVPGGDHRFVGNDGRGHDERT